MENFSPPNPPAKPKTPLLKRSIVDVKKLDNIFHFSENKTETIVFLALILAVVIGYFAFRPLYNSYKKNRINIANNRIEKALLEEKKAKLDNLSQEIMDKRDFIAEVEEVVPKTQEIPEVLVTLEKAASKNSLFLTNFTPKENTASQSVVSGGAGTGAKSTTGGAVLISTYKTQEVTFDLTGTYSSLYDFMKDLENNIRPFHIKVINVSGGGEMGAFAQPTLRFSVIANIYYQEGADKK